MWSFDEFIRRRPGGRLYNKYVVGEDVSYVESYEQVRRAILNSFLAFLRNLCWYCQAWS